MINKNKNKKIKIKIKIKNKKKYEKIKLIKQTNKQTNTNKSAFMYGCVYEDTRVCGSMEGMHVQIDVNLYILYTMILSFLIVYSFYGMLVQ